MISVKLFEGKKEVWEDFVSEYAAPGFLQSWGWGEFQKSLGREIFRIGVHKSSSLAGVSFLVLEKSKLTTFLYCPAGPVFIEWEKDIFSEWLSFVQNLAKEKNATFVRVDTRRLSDPGEKTLKTFDFIPAPGYTQPQCTGVINLTLDEETLRSKMSPSTRHNVNAASRKEVVVREGGVGDIKIFMKLLRETAKRKGLVLPLEKSYHEKQFEALNEQGLMKIFLAEVKKEPLGVALVVFYSDTAYYLHAANSLTQKELRASYPLVWATILEAKKAGLKTFDFWGIAPTDNPKDPWAGVTSFKLSFGAERVCFPSPFDLPMKPTYAFIRFAEHFRKPLRKILRFRQ